jgi:choloylglycine hydrolase
MWRTVDDQKNLVMFYESTIAPNVIWIDMKKFDFSKGTPVKKLETEDSTLAGEVNKAFKESKAVEFARPERRQGSLVLLNETVF